MKRTVNWTLNILIVLVLIIIGYLLWENHLMKKEEADNTNLAMSTYEEITCTQNEVKSEEKNPRVTNSDADVNEIIGYIIFPSLGESTALLQGDLSDDQIAAMDRGVSHDPRSSIPGEAGNTVLAGHRELFFKNFLDLEVGDDVILNVGDNIYVYEITSYEVIDPEDADKVFYSNNEDLLVMYTCYPIEAWKPFNNRLVVKAKPIAKTTVENCESVTKNNIK